VTAARPRERVRHGAALALVALAAVAAVPAASAVEPAVEGSMPVERAPAPPGLAPPPDDAGATVRASGPGFDWIGAVAVFFTAIGAFAAVLVVHDAGRGLSA
jgi:hypothetical protein